MNEIPKGLRPDPDAEQWRQVEALASTLAPDQAIWVSGYFAGLGRSLRARDGAELVEPPLADLPGEAEPTEAATRTLTILYGTETGNSREFAREIESRAREVGLEARAADLADYKARGLKDEQDVILVTSTHGEGDPPEPAVDFFEFVLGRKAPKLAGVRYAVLGLGDSTYEFFCGAAKKLDERFAELGAERLRDRIDCDLDYEEPASDWIGQVLAGLAEETREARPAATSVPAAAGAQTPAHGKRNPFQLTASATPSRRRCSITSP